MHFGLRWIKWMRVKLLICLYSLKFFIQAYIFLNISKSISHGDFNCISTWTIYGGYKFIPTIRVNFDVFCENLDFSVRPAKLNLFLITLATKIVLVAKWTWDSLKSDWRKIKSLLWYLGSNKSLQMTKSCKFLTK